MFRVVKAGLIGVLALAVVGCASTKFNVSWRAPGTAPLNFKGKKVVALVISKDESVRLGAEEALAREITKLGPIGVTAYSVIPKELLQDKEKAKEFLTKAGVVGAVTMRVIGKDQNISSSPATYYGGTAYATFWGGGYYGTGWGGVYDPGYLRTDTIVSVETLVYSLEQDKLVWAGRSETTNPDKVRTFVAELAVGAAAQMRKLGLVK
jgi:hypothetical protein